MNNDACEQNQTHILSERHGDILDSILLATQMVSMPVNDKKISLMKQYMQIVVPVIGESLILASKVFCKVLPILHYSSVVTNMSL